MKHFSKTNHLLKISILILGFSLHSLAQGQVTRDLSGLITLDVTPAVADLTLEITVRNHAFVVLPPPLGIIRPIQSTVSTQVLIPQGESSVAYSLPGIVEDPVDYTIQIKCLACEEFVSTQYYDPSGNKFGLANSVYIDPDDLPEQLDLTLLSNASISGQINLTNQTDSDLDLSIEVSSFSNPDLLLGSDSSLRIPKDQQSMSYQIAGIRRSNDSLLVSFHCTNCLGGARRKQVYPSPLSSLENHQDINFTLIDRGKAVMAPIIDLLINELDE